MASYVISGYCRILFLIFEVGLSRRCGPQPNSKLLINYGYILLLHLQQVND
ncbi:hypothetical protein MKW94_009886 [Papaver nudicaule]|uniref:Uncharacterized protein n=1 Tax=Papaver nudicaule TaxID=74823 RepID=A0AA41S1E2_PAPNU|nr:hypothetical protein [Papaver nudicaule]